MTSTYPFSKGNPDLRRVWDATTLADFLKDPASYYLSRVKGWRSRYPAPPLVYGVMVQSALERYDRIRGAGGSTREGLDAALDYAIEEAKNPLGYGYTLDEISAEFGNPRQKNHRTLKTLLRTIVWYEAEYGDDDPAQIITMNGTPAVEVPFRIPLPIKTPYGENYILAGHMDAAVDMLGNKFVMERKHTVTTIGKSYLDGWKANTQFSTYALVGSSVLGEPVDGILLDAIQVGVNFSRFFRKEILRTKGQQDEFLNSVMLWIKQAEYMAENKHWPINEGGLSMYGGSSFRNILTMDPAHRERYLEEHFYQEEPWTPLTERE